MRLTWIGIRDQFPVHQNAEKPWEKDIADYSATAPKDKIMFSFIPLVGLVKSAVLLESLRIDDTCTRT